VRVELRGHADAPVGAAARAVAPPTLLGERARGVPAAPHAVRLAGAVLVALAQHAVPGPAAPNAVRHAVGVVLAVDPLVGLLLEGRRARHAGRAGRVGRAARQDVGAGAVVPAHVLEPALIEVVLELPGSGRHAAR